MIGNVYDYYVSTYGNKTISRHDSHKRSELRTLYNNIVKLNMATPLYNVDMSESSQKLAIDIKEGARALSDTIYTLTDIDEGVLSTDVVAVSDNPALVTGTYIGSAPDMDDSLEFDVKQLAQPQINQGSFLSTGAKNLFPGKYSFNIDFSNVTYSLEFEVNSDDNNNTIQKKIVNLINKSNIGVTADLKKNDYAQQAIVLTSDDTGSPLGSPTQFNIYDNETSQLTGAVSLFGLSDIFQYPSNAVFDLNGQSTISESNTFVIDDNYEITLNGTSKESGIANMTLKRDGSVLKKEFEKLSNKYNNLLSLSKRSDNFELKRLYRNLSSVADKYNEILKQNGLVINEDKTMSVDEDLLNANTKSGDIFDSIKKLKTFQNDLKTRTDSIEVNPMEYINKQIVAYKNPNKLISTSYSTSIYVGMMFNRYV